MSIKLKELNHRRFCDWIVVAENKIESDPVFAFISAWIAFNYYYGTFAKANYTAFEQWANERCNGDKKDKSQWLFLINHPDFSTVFSDFSSIHSDVLDRSIELPVINMLDPRKGVPIGSSGMTPFKNLTTEQVFEIIYQIRNNLFHGDKDPFTDKRDRELSEIAVIFIFPLLLEILKHTYGYERDAFEVSESQTHVDNLLNPNNV